MKKNNSYNILGIIPARSGSKGVINKNIRLLNDKPLVQYTIEAALGSDLITDFIVSTNSKNIAGICRDAGANIPFYRPDKLASDNIESFPVIVHALNQMENCKNVKYDYFIMLQPTSPLRVSSDIDDSLAKLINTKNDSIVSVVDVRGAHPLRMKKINSKQLLENYIKQNGENMKPRQELEKVYIRNGSIYASRKEVLIKYKSLVGPKCMPYVMSKEKSVNIDNNIDFLIASQLMSQISQQKIK